MAKSALYFITGSSGSGKTTLLKGVVEAFYPNLTAHHFDDLGVPGPEEMIARYGGPEQWQAYVTRQWIEKIAHPENTGLVVLEGQVRPSVILDAANKVGVSPLHITLIDCSHEERRRRLIEARAQPELNKFDMYAWAAYLRGQADALKLEIIDTTTLSPGEAIQKLAGSIGRFAEETKIRLDRRNNTKLNL